jgi:DNA-directed RNA polymerase subunit L
MKAVQVEIEDHTYRSLLQAGLTEESDRARFLRDAIQKAVRELEEERMRRAYELQPQEDIDLNDWTGFGEYKP